LALERFFISAFAIAGAIVVFFGFVAYVERPTRRRYRDRTRASEGATDDGDDVRAPTGRSPDKARP